MGDDIPNGFGSGGFYAARFRNTERLEIVRPSNIVDINIKSLSLPSRLRSFLVNLIK